MFLKICIKKHFLSSKLFCCLIKPLPIKCKGNFSLTMFSLSQVDMCIFFFSVFHLYFLFICRLCMCRFTFVLRICRLLYHVYLFLANALYQLLPTILSKTNFDRNILYCNFSNLIYLTNV